MVGPLFWKKKLDVKGFLRPGDDRDIFIEHFEIEKDHFFKIKPLYKALHDLLADDGWSDPRGGDNFEDFYWERIDAKGLKEHQVWWRIVKNPRYGSKYFRYVLKIDFQSIAVKGAEIAYEGKKTKVEKADFIVRIWTWVQFDWQNKLYDSMFRSWIPFIMKKFFKKEIEDHKLVLYKYAQKLRGLVKDYLDIEEAGERPRLFHPEGGYKNQF